MELNIVTKTREVLIKLTGKIASHNAVILVDCGATGQFVSSSFVTRHNLSLATSGPSTSVTLADGHRQSSPGNLSVPVTISTYVDTLDFTVTELRGYDAILGMEWLKKYNPEVDWRQSSVILKDLKGCKHVLQPEPSSRPSQSPSSNQSPSSTRPSPSSQLNFISASQIEHQHRQGKIELAFLVYPQDICSTQATSSPSETSASSDPSVINKSAAINAVINSTVPLLVSQSVPPCQTQSVNSPDHPSTSHEPLCQSRVGLDQAQKGDTVKIVTGNISPESNITTVTSSLTSDHLNTLAVSSDSH